MEQSRKPNRLLQIAYVLAALIGLWFGFDIGDRISGVFLGVMMAINAALCAVALIAMIEANLPKRKPDSRATPPAERP
jgi:hypothetical protein